MKAISDKFTSSLAGRHRIGRIFEWTCFSSTWLSMLFLAILLGGIFWQAAGWVNWSFLTNFDSRHPEKAGILAGLWGSVWLIGLTGLFSVPIGVGAALYLQEYARDSKLTRLIQLNLSNLAGVPSIVYGILGMTVFVRMFGVFGAEERFLEIPMIIPTLWAESAQEASGDEGEEGEPAEKTTSPFAITTWSIPLPFGRTVLSGALTMSLLVLPVIVVASQEALRAVPPSIRHAAYALGATRWQSVRHQVLPAAMPGILTGVILAMSRAIGETAPLILIGAMTYVAFTPGDITGPLDFVRYPEGVLQAPFDSFTALPIQIFNWVSRPKTEYQHVAAAGIVVLMGVLLVLNGTAVLLRHRFQKRTRW